MRSLKDTLGPIPYLDGAACKGRTDLFEVDPTLPLAVMHRLQERAMWVCESCPALRECADWTRPDGDALVWAQGGKPMFDVKARERRMKRYRTRRLRLKREAEAAQVRAEAEALLADYREVPR